ncbi:MAG: hypothetical protein MRJ65_15430 [Candidatus Brocadiaceae bacterium]|nr:hypothetical protein [Candidatus Brocadiaceae bacterium]
MITQKAFISPERLRERMEELLKRCSGSSVNDEDIDCAINEGASMLCSVLRILDYKAGIDIFEQLCRLNRRRDQEDKNEHGRI